MVDEEPKTVKAEELVDEERLAEVLRQHCLDVCKCVAPMFCKRRRSCLALMRTALAELNISAIIPYTAGPCHRGFNKHPYDKCPDLEHAGCPYITMPGCFFQDGAVLVRKPRTREEARGCRGHVVEEKERAETKEEV